MEIPNNRRALEVFSEGLCIQGMQSTWTHYILIGHDAPIETFTDKDWASSASTKLQVKSTCQVGWLLGPHRDMNATNLGSAIYASSENVKQFPIAIKFKVIWTNSGKLGKSKGVVAAHIKTDFTKASLCHKILFQICPSGNQKGYLRMQFEPNTAEIWQPVTTHIQQNVKILKTNRRSFSLGPGDCQVVLSKGSIVLNPVWVSQTWSGW
jgi:hypothetical protein